jgi:small-conductance mechanosensitive channel
MAPIFGFRSRDPARDRQTDISRLDRLAKLLDQIAAEVEAEKNGLENRYRTKATNAAFLVEAMENGAASSSRSSEVSELTKSILNYERRIAALARQNELMKDLRHSLDAIFDESAQPSSTTETDFANPAAGTG